ncbi:CHASE domain-containing protein [Trichlorobacter lovleyi]|uniref:CHASE domain-containing protein n=1 Tax=Trichlorobacter lovleyi TaxID=313985 RepID=UPI00223FAA92|nr:CHASE domain-containing protein [Trichlorobacter lovleyi]QOX78968.1 CHASE domain-containing protein [Trichlorobacter lovleyi]
MNPEPSGTAAEQRRRLHWSVPTVVLSGVMITMVLFGLVRQSELASFKTGLESDVALRTDTIINKINDSQLVVIALRSFFTASDEVTRKDFSDFTLPFLQERNEIKALSWNPRITNQQRKHFEDQEGSEQQREQFAITERDSKGGLIAAAVRDAYYPIHYIEPLADNRKALGFDVGSHPVRLAALGQARDTGKPTATERIMLVQDGQPRYSVLVFNPLYAAGMPVTTVAERRQALQGFTVVVLNMEKLLTAALGKTASIGLPFDLLDLSAPKERQLLHHWSARLNGNAAWFSSLIPDLPATTRKFAFCGREWALVMAPNQSYLARNYPLAYWLLLPAGFLLSILLGAYFRILTTQRQALEEQVLKRTSELRTSEARLKELNNNLEERVSERTNQLEAAMQALSVSKEQAETANRAKSIFLANMSHEIRTPLNAVLGFSQIVMRDPALSPDHRHNLQIVNRSGEQLLALVNDVIDVAKIEAGRVALEKTVFDLPALLDQLLEQFRPKAHAVSLQLMHESLGDMPRYITADAEKLRHILTNLLDNALKFTQEGGVSLRSRVCCREGQDWLEIEVQDSGQGISPEDRERIFNAFEQAEAGRIHQGGTGLGLTISRDYARLMGGDLSVTSSPGHGSCFHLVVPVIPVSGEPDLQQQERPNRIKRLRPGQPPCRILVVDDRDTNREILVKMLAPLGCTMLEAVNGQAGLEGFITHKPHLVLMDVVMPVMDGREAIRRIRALPDGKKVPIIAVSASVFEDQLQEVMEAGASAFLRKPLREEELYAKLLSLLPFEFEYVDERGAGDEAAAASPAELDHELAQLPQELCSRLIAAARGLDKTGLQEVIMLFAATAPGLAEQLRSLADSYRFDLIEELVAQRINVEDNAGGQHD